MNNFYVKVENNEQANEVIELAVKLGAERYDTTHDSPVDKEWLYWGVRNGVVYGLGCASSFDVDDDESATEYTLPELRAIVDGQWPDEDDQRQQAVGQNGNDGAVYEYVPKVGDICEAYADDIDPEECRFLETDGKDAVVKWAKSCNCGYDVLPLIHWKFRPIRTERELFIEAAMMIKTTGAFELDEFIGMMYDAGFKAPEVAE